MSRPRIGLSCDMYAGEGKRGPFAKLYAAYIDAVAVSGGVPIPLVACPELIPEQLAGVDGLVLTGGADYDPAWYGQEPEPETDVIYERRGQYDLALFREALEREVPMLAVCGGLQLVNVALGGSLVQHIPRRFGTALRHADGASHSVEVDAASLLADIVGAGAFEVNSYHHQAADEVAEGLHVTARAEDGVIEAIEGTEEPFLLCVQWHPERLTDLPRHRALFEALVREAGSGR